jgi:dihydrofolate synthase / folylpolyglutamate synthase
VDGGLTASAYKTALDRLFARTTQGSKYGLERIEMLLDRLGNPHRSFPSLHVAGTNGKGSVVASIEALLADRGARVGRYTSPHLVDFRERIVVAGEQISERDVIDFIDRWTDTGADIGATFFEITTALAFDHFAKSAVDVAVIETGLGGRLDATNVLLPKVAVVTSIGLDHTDLLGPTTTHVAQEKGGIFKAGSVAVIGERDEAIRGVLRSLASERGAGEIIDVPARYPVSNVVVSGSGTEFVLGERGRIRTALIGQHQAQNAAIAIAATEAFLGESIHPDEASQALGRVVLPGRFQRVGKFILDVAHNPDGARVLAETIRLAGIPRPRTALFSVLGDKDWRSMLEILGPEVDTFVLSVAPTAPSDRRWNLEDVVQLALELGLHAVAEPAFDMAVDRVIEVDGPVVITGSFHTVGDAMVRLQLTPGPG